MPGWLFVYQPYVRDGEAEEEFGRKQERRSSAGSANRARFSTSRLPAAARIGIQSADDELSSKFTNFYSKQKWSTHDMKKVVDHVAKALKVGSKRKFQTNWEIHKPKPYPQRHWELSISGSGTLSESCLDPELGWHMWGEIFHLWKKYLYLYQLDYSNLLNIIFESIIWISILLGLIDLESFKKDEMLLEYHDKVFSNYNADQYYLQLVNT